MQSKNYICERCGEPASICHHRKYLNDQNVNDLSIALGFDNLECLCRDCHNKEHGLKHSIILFDKSGSCSSVKKSSTEQAFDADREKINEMLEKIKAENRSNTAEKE